MTPLFHYETFGPYAPIYIDEPIFDDMTGEMLLDAGEIITYETAPTYVRRFYWDADDRIIVDVSLYNAVYQLANDPPHYFTPDGLTQIV